MAVNEVVPVLQIDDHEVARRFDLDQIGFELDFEYQAEPGVPFFMGIKDGELCLHLSEHGRGHPVSEVYVFVDGIEAWARRTEEGEVQVESGPLRRPWGDTEIHVIDPFRSTLRFSQLGTH